MAARTTRLFLLAIFALATSVAGLAQLPCGVANEIYCQSWDGSFVLYASQNDTNGLGNFATVYDNFNLSQTVDVESFHWVGGYFSPPNQAPITAWTLTFYVDNNSAPGATVFTQTLVGNGGETFIGNVGGFPLYVYSLNFNSFDMAPGSYWASVVPDLGFPPQWGWATSASDVGDQVGWQCLFGSCVPVATDFAFAIDGKAVPEPGTLIMLGTGILGLAGPLRRKLL